MLKFFEICFWTGVIFTVVTFIIGQFGDFLNFDGDVDLDGSVDGFNISPIKPAIITAFVTVFGGVGIILTQKGITVFLTILISAFIAFSIALMMFKFIIVPLKKAENTSAVSRDTLIGQRARVKLSMGPDRFGAITYEVNGNIYEAPARAIDEIEIIKGEEVTIVKIEKNVFYVAKL